MILAYKLQSIGDEYWKMWEQDCKETAGGGNARLENARLKNGEWKLRDNAAHHDCHLCDKFIMDHGEFYQRSTKICEQLFRQLLEADNGNIASSLLSQRYLTFAISNRSVH